MECESTIPIPLDSIVDNKLKINVIPVPGLKRAYNVDGFALRDLQTIEVDQYIYDHQKNRYRFTLAHELGHILLQKDIIKQHKIKSVDEWKKIYSELNNDDRKWLEWQSYSFGGLVLVPQVHLKSQFEAQIINHKNELRLAIEKGYSRDQYKDVFISKIISDLCPLFETSQQVIEKRINKDK